VLLSFPMNSLDPPRGLCVLGGRDASQMAVDERARGHGASAADA
jgi:hypothetical protein